MLTMADLRTLATAALISETQTLCSRGLGGSCRRADWNTTPTGAHRPTGAVGRHSPMPFVFDPGRLDASLKPPCRTTVRPTGASVRRELPIVVGPGTTMGKWADQRVSTVIR